MYELLNAKLLILPDWVMAALEAHSLTPNDIKDSDGLESILSADDVRFYLNQVEALVNNVGSKDGSTTPVRALLDSFPILHTNTNGVIRGGSQLQEFVKINTLYGTEFARYDFFNGLNMLSYLPRGMAASLSETVRVDPYVEYLGNDLFVLRFTTGLYSDALSNGYPARAKEFIDVTTRMVMSNCGFDAVKGTKLFDLYCVCP